MFDGQSTFNMITQADVCVCVCVCAAYDGI